MTLSDRRSVTIVVPSRLRHTVQECMYRVTLPFFACDVPLNIAAMLLSWSTH